MSELQLQKAVANGCLPSFRWNQPDWPAPQPIPPHASFTTSTTPGTSSPAAAPKLNTTAFSTFGEDMLLDSLPAATAISGIASLGGSAFNLGGAIYQANMQHTINTDNLNFQQKQIDRSYDVAHSMGLASPSQVSASPTVGTFTGTGFASIPRSPFLSSLD